MPPRKLPLLTRETRPFWTGGEHGQLLIQCCTTCGLWQHPPLPLCAKCRTETAEPQPVSGKGRVTAFTINHEPWVPGLDEAFVFAAVELAEQSELYVFSNVLGDPASVTSGMPVRVCFEHCEDVWLPLFEADQEAGDAA